MSHLPSLEAAGQSPLPPWAEALRERGRERFETHGLPHRRLEDWKYTSLKGLEAEPAPVSGTLDQPALLREASGMKRRIFVAVIKLQFQRYRFSPSVMPDSGQFCLISHFTSRPIIMTRC